MAHFLHSLRKVVNLVWHYFATSYGKGAVDGIGGTVKRMVWKAISTRKVAVVNDAKTFADVAAKLCKSVKVTFICSEELGDTVSWPGKMLSLCTSDNRNF